MGKKNSQSSQAMTNDTKSSRKAKDVKINNTEDRNVADKLSTSSGATSSDTLGLRRSTRETSSKINKTPSPSSTRKSERLEKKSPPVIRKSERVEQQSAPSPLRRSERGLKQSSSSSGSKELDVNMTLLLTKKNVKRERPVTHESRDVHSIEKQEKKRMDARAYRKLFKQKAMKDNVAGYPNKQRRNDDFIVRSSTKNNGDDASKNGGEKLDEFRGESIGKSFEGTAEGSNSIVRKAEKETFENHVEIESSYMEQKDQIVESKQQSDSAEMAEENLHGELVDSTLNEGTPDYLTESQSDHEARTCKRQRTSDTATVILEETVNDVIASSSHERRGNNLEQSCAACSKKQRIGKVLEQQEPCSCKTKVNQDLCGITVAKDRGETEALITTGNAHLCSSVLPDTEPLTDSHLDSDLNTCLLCKRGGWLLCCNGLGCKSGYHMSCIDPALKDLPFGVWYCFMCSKKKIELGARSVSEGVESIWDAREVEVSNGDGFKERQLFVKYKGLAHVHNCWVPESQLLLEAPLLVAKFNQKNEVAKYNQKWVVPQRLLQKKKIVTPRQQDKFNQEHAECVLDCCYEWLVKWHGLDYEHVTWESQKTVLNLPEAQSLIRDYENRHDKAKRAKINEKFQMEKDFPVKLSHLSAGAALGSDSNHLDFVNILRDVWHRGQNTVLIDDQVSLERVLRVILFLTSLSYHVSKPILIITTSDMLNLWDQEFFHIASSDVVVYCGNKDLRKGIRTLEFNEEGNCALFQYLITSMDIFIEDFNVFDSIEWNVVVIDECQFSGIYSHISKVIELRTDMKLLLVNGQLKDDIAEHLLLLDCQSGCSNESSVILSNNKISNLKDSLSRYLVNGGKSESSKFEEYWVPVHLSPMQLEQYCASLLSNALSLGSSSKNDTVGVLRDILISTRKCCDHPYITNPLLQTSLLKDCKVVEILDIGIQASGKLQLLDAMLSDIRNRGLRVLILFQSSGGGVCIGDILDDFVRQRFGVDSYERIDAFITPAKKQVKVHNFNNKQGMFILLLETRACSPTIKVSSVNTVIIYGSDWSPMNDLRNLQKITIEMQREQIKVFRLYSLYTVEEKALILGKQGKKLDSILQNMNSSTIHMLLIWGSSYLFENLANFHGGSPLFENSLLDVTRELSVIISGNTENGTDNLSQILKVKQKQGSYSVNFPLPGELKVQLMGEDPPHIFWKKLLEGKEPRWKYSSVSTQRIRKRSQLFDLQQEIDIEGNKIPKKCKKLPTTSDHAPRAKSAVNDGDIAAKNREGTIGVPAQSLSDVLPESNSQPTALHSNYTNSSVFLSNKSPEMPKANMNEFNDRTNVHNAQKSLHLQLKPEIAKLCGILQLPDGVKTMVESFLEYVMNNHRVNNEPATVLEAFQISLCWTASSLLKYKLDHKESLVLAKRYMNFGCRKEEADFVYSMLRCLKKLFLHHTGKLRTACSPNASQILLKDPIPDHLPSRPSQSRPSDPQVSGDQVLPHFVLARYDISKSIKDIEKKCDKQMAKLIAKQEKEKEQVFKKYEEEKAQLDNEHKAEAAVIRLLANNPLGSDKLKLLDIHYAKKFEELEHCRETSIKTLKVKHIAAINGLKEGKNDWVEGVKSWAQVELLNKMSSLEAGYTKAESLPLSSGYELQNLENTLFTPVGEAPVEVTEALSSNGDEEDVLPGLQSLSEQISRSKSNMLGGEAQRGMADSMHLRKTFQNVVSDTALSSKVCTPDMEVSLGVPEAAGSSDSLENTDRRPCSEEQNILGTTLVSPCKEFPTEGSDSANTLGSLEDVAPVNPPLGGKTCDFTVSCMHDGILLGVPDTASPETGRDLNISGKKERVSTLAPDHKSIHWGTVAGGGNQECLSSDNIAGANQQNGDASSGGPETNSSKECDIHDIGTCGSRIICDKKYQDARNSSIIEGTNQVAGKVTVEVPKSAPGKAEEGGIAYKRQDENGQTDQNVFNEDLQSLDKATVHEQDAEASVRITEIPDGEFVTCDNDILETNGVCPTLSDKDDGAISIYSCDDPSPFLPPPTFSENSQVTLSECQQNREDHIESSIAEFPRQMVENQTDLLNQTILQPTTHFAEHPPVETPVSTSGIHVADTMPIPASSTTNSHYVQAATDVGIPLPLHHDPLQNELERIRKETDQIINIHEGRVSILLFNCLVFDAK
ncbi:hypothetical protein K2173_016575 [Erythroxylum novogranatense]|uniref:Helicase protein MOM1-like n=1 Tax=Erythroxylum novogranatense TaxID=1862640 RepID=A0AAV8SGU9_9ROSI|nr:hypothetical protein K2173_016575 [Erythroxylum novogranatense]